MKKRAFSYLRWSTSEQSFGDSERRQLQLAESYCARNGLQLVETVKDAGVSGFHGKNRNGELGRLVNTINNGDVLLIEDCDRLSR